MSDPKIVCLAQKTRVDCSGARSQVYDGWMDSPEQTPKPLLTIGIFLVVFGVLSAFAAPFATNGPEFAMTVGYALTFFCSTWIFVKVVGHFTNPNRPPSSESPDAPE